MGLKTKEVIDSNATATGIMQDIFEIDRMERLLSTELSTEDLFRIDSAILMSLRNTEDFSRSLLTQLEHGKFEDFAVPPEIVDTKSSIEQEVEQIQQTIMADITQPLSNMFDEMANLVAEVFI